jgi:hypothetical protein
MVVPHRGLRGGVTAAIVHKQLSDRVVGAADRQGRRFYARVIGILQALDNPIVDPARREPPRLTTGCPTSV